MKDLQIKLDRYLLAKLAYDINSDCIPKSEINVHAPFGLLIDYKHKGKRTSVTVGVRFNSKDMPFSIEVVYQGDFVLNKDLDKMPKESRDRLVKTFCAAILIPFVRETIAEVTRKGDFPPLIMSSINLHAFYENALLKENKSIKKAAVKNKATSTRKSSARKV